MIKILTNDGVENSNIDGARGDNFNSGNVSGIVMGALSEGSFFAASSNLVAFASCELRMCGHRIIIDETITKSLGNTPTQNQRLSFIAQIIVNMQRVVEFTTFLQDSSVTLKQDKLYASLNGAGTYQLEIGRLTFTTNSQIIDVVRTADVITGGAGGGNGGFTVGTITTHQISESLPANVDIDYNEVTKKTDFVFDIPDGKTGAKGDTGATFTPVINADNSLSWTNDKNLTNPPPNDVFKNIKITADNAKTTADGVDAKATTANENSRLAVEKANQNLTDMQGVQLAYETKITKQQTDYETVITKKQIDYETKIDGKILIIDKTSKDAMDASNTAVQISTAAKNISIAADNAVNNIRSPATGLLGNVQSAIDSIFERLTNGITAASYDALNLTAAIYDAKNITAIDYSMRASAILTL